jgi:hypothetical protein
VIGDNLDGPLDSQETTFASEGSPGPRTNAQGTGNGVVGIVVRGYRRTGATSQEPQ